MSKKGFKNTNSVTLRLFQGANGTESAFEVVKVSGNPQNIDLDELVAEPIEAETSESPGELETFDGYFPEDGYDYSQHLREINPDRFIATVRKPAEQSIDAKDRELAEVVAALNASDDAESTEIDNEFISKLGPLDERTRLGLLWGEDQVEEYISMPTEKLLAIQSKIRDIEQRAQAKTDEDFESFFSREFCDSKIGGLTSDDVNVEEADSVYSECEDDSGDESEGSEAEGECEDPEAMRQECLEATKRIVQMNKRLQVSVLDTDQDESDIVIVPFSNVPEWDCQSVLSTRSNTFNHPGLIGRPRREVTKAPHVEPIAEEEETIDTPVKSVSTLRKKNETPEERRERKKAIKEFQREQRACKKADEKERKNQINAEKRSIAALKHGSYGDIPAGVPKFNL
jgi:protein LTV1